MLRTKFLFCITLIMFLSRSAMIQGQVKELPKCLSIVVATRDSVVDEELLLPQYQDFGFRLIRNGVYDFIIDGKKYLQALLVNIYTDGFCISENWSFTGKEGLVSDTLFVSLTQDIAIRLALIDNGVSGVPTKIKNKQYSFRIVASEQHCGIKNAEIGNSEFGHFYFTKYGWKKVAIVNGNPYLFENNTKYLLRRK
ncbi:hypothetical protein ACFLT1_03800 [Bacteroidota bacterium]